MPTMLGCITCAVAWCGVGGVTVDDRLGTVCLRGVIARRGAAVKGFIPTHWLTDSCGSAHSRLAPAAVHL